MSTISNPKIIDMVIAKLAIKTLPTISGEPEYESLNKLTQSLYDNAATLQTTLDGGRYGHVVLIMNYIMYATLVTGTPWEDPDKPSTIPTIATNSTVAHHQ